MSTQAKEIKFHLCSEHVDHYEQTLKRTYPDYIFNTFLNISIRKCGIAKCNETSHYESIGVKIPETAGELTVPKRQKPIQEIFTNAKEILEKGPAIERLTVYLKTKIISQNPGLTTNIILKNHAKLILAKLKIDEQDYLTVKNISDIVKELGLYPYDFGR
jgi:hypothetical protein